MSTGFLRRGWSTVALGVGLGCLACFLGAALLTIVLVNPLDCALPGGLGPARWLQGIGDCILYGVVPGTLVLFIFTGLPAAVGGALIGLVLCTLAGRRASLTAPGALIGCVVGGLAVVAGVLLESAWSQDPLWLTRGAWPILLSGLAIGTVAGGCVGMLLARYEEGRRRRTEAQ